MLSPLFLHTRVLGNQTTPQIFTAMGGEGLVSVVNEDLDLQPLVPRTYQVVVAATRNYGVGKDGKLPWKLSSDMKFFKELTTITLDPSKKNAVVMRRKTRESIPLEFRPLPGRLNFVLTRFGIFDIATAENVVICGSVDSALDLLATSPYSLSLERFFIIGEGQILRETINASGCDTIHLTEIESKVECDTFIPPVDKPAFQPWYSSFPVSESKLRYSFVTYVRVRSPTLVPPSSTATVATNGNSETAKADLDKLSILPKMIIQRHEEYMYL